MRLLSNNNILEKTLRPVKNTGKITMLFAAFIMLASSVARKETPHTFNEQIDKYLSAGLLRIKNSLQVIKYAAASKASRSALKNSFSQARKEYKKLAILTEYFNPQQTKQLNGPAIPRIEGGIADKIIPPQGFQAIEQVLYAEWDSGKSYGDIIQLTNEMIGVIASFENEPDRHFKFTRELVYDAIRAAIVTLTSMGITGADSPIANLSLQEANATCDGISNLLTYLKAVAPKAQAASFDKLRMLLKKTHAYLKTQKDFNRFDRLQFITNYINPFYSQLVQVRDQAGIGLPPGVNSINLQATSLFASDAFKIDFFSPPKDYWVTPERVSLGKKLFFDPILSGTKNRSCASCHQPGQAFTDGLDRPYSIDSKHKLSRNTPTLVNAGFQTKQFFDSRADILENQLSEVIHNTEEMEGTLLEGITNLKKDSLYVSLFRKAYPADITPITPFTLANAISSYIRSLRSFNSAFDKYMRGNTRSMSSSQKRGFNLFAGKAKCATCHFIPLFNGVVPPAFAETESEILGVPKTTSKNPAVLDDDPGKFNTTRSIIHKFSFKTPTLRNVELTAPYMHNGVFNTLEEVLEFYNNGGGKGLGIAPEFQTLPFEKLNLSESEIGDIIAFMRALTDTSFAK
jgi:cytochrome c peroxidase